MYIKVIISDPRHMYIYMDISYIGTQPKSTNISQICIIYNF